jgi:hypothetical protein
VFGPPVLALVAVVAMVMTVADPIPPAPAWAPEVEQPEIRALPSSLVASARPVATSRPRRPAIREEMILADMDFSMVTEIWSPPLMLPAPGLLEPRSVQAP